MQTHIQRQVSHALLLTEEDLRNISALVEDNYGATSFSVTCSEGSTLVLENLVELLAYENPGFRRIESISICAVVTREEACTILLRNDSHVTCGMSIRDTKDERALKVADELGKRIQECKPYYSIFTKLSPGGIMFAVLFIYLTIIVWLRVLARKPLQSDFPFIDAMYIMWPILALFFAFHHYSKRGWEWVFPKVWFSIGRQIREFERRSKVRNWVLGSIFGGMLIGVARNLVTNAISK